MRPSYQAHGPIPEQRENLRATWRLPIWTTTFASSRLRGSPFYDRFTFLGRSPLRLQPATTARDLVSDAASFSPKQACDFFDSWIGDRVASFFRNGFGEHGSGNLFRSAGRPSQTQAAQIRAAAGASSFLRGSTDGIFSVSRRHYGRYRLGLPKSRIPWLSHDEPTRSN